MDGNPYDVLGIPETATEEEVVAAYRERVKETHPDTGGSQEAFKRVRTAYEQIQTGDSTQTSRRPRRQKTNREPSTEPAQPNKATVEYLDYEVVRAAGWDISSEAFEKADEANLAEGYGTFTVHRNETVLDAAERNGFEWPYSCRGGACANCAVRVVTGDVRTPRHTILTDLLLDEGYRLSCIGEPLTETVQLVYNVKHEDRLGDMLLPPQ